MHAKLYIPKVMSLGQQNRPGTYTGKLGFLNPYDEKGKLRFKDSWENWRDKKIEPKEIQNLPTEGFIINKNAGGRHSGWYWDSGREAKIRVWDPRDFEIEITIPNMLYILEQSNSYRGKGLEGNFVYAYNGSQLMLIPVDSEEYRGSIEFTDLKYQKVTTKELTEGCTVFTKSEETLIYIGKYEVVKPHSGWDSKTFGVAKELVFAKGDPKKPEFVFLKADKIAKIMDVEISSEFSNLVEKFQNKKLGFATKELVMESFHTFEPATINRYARNVKKEQEVGKGIVFVPDGDMYKGYRIIQVNKEKKTSSYSSEWSWDYFVLEHTCNLRIDDGINKILPGKDEPRKANLSEIRGLNKFRATTTIPDAYHQKKRVLG